HVGIEDWDLDMLKEHIRWQKEVWEPLTDFRHYVDEIAWFSPKRYPWRNTVYTNVMNAETKAEAFEAYRANQSRDRKTKKAVHWSKFWKKLHPADPSSFLNEELPHNTLEWRVWPMVDDPAILKEFVEFSVKNTHDPMPYKEVEEWVRHWGEKSSYMKKKRPENLNRKLYTENIK